MEDADFSGYATKAGLKCSDGRTITKQAFQHMDGLKVPLVWSHGHKESTNVLGHAFLEVVDDGVRAHGFFNDTVQGINGKKLVMHGDIESLSIWANNLVEKSSQVLHGIIREVSLVLSGANPGAKIDQVRVAHGDDPSEFEELADEAIIHTGLGIDVPEVEEDEELEHSEATVREIFEAMTEEQQGILAYLVSRALTDKNGSTAEHSDNTDEGDLEHKEGDGDVSRNVFEKNNTPKVEKVSLSHEDVQGIVADAMKPGQTLKTAVQAYALAHGIENIDILFPDARTLADRPEWNKRRTEWVAGVINGTRHSPFSRVKSIVADLTQEAARAKGYIKGNYKKEEWFGLTSRVTTPTTIYKKQKLDRDDMVDITDMDVVAWLKGEMRLMLEEELARAILIGDGRDPDDEDKIRDPGSAAEGAGIRSIANENELYATTVNVKVAGGDYNSVVESVMRARRFYKGTGMPTFYTTSQMLVEMLLSKDNDDRRRWNTTAELAAALMVSNIVEVEVMDENPDLLGIIVNLADYNVGADRGGEINMFDDFDIDYNQYKYLIETRVSGALVKIKSALVLRSVVGTAVLVVASKPAFNSATGVVTIPAVTGVQYRNADTDAVLASGAQAPLALGATLNVEAVALAGYYFATSELDSWTFTRPSA